MESPQPKSKSILTPPAAADSSQSPAIPALPAQMEPTESTGTGAGTVAASDATTDPIAADPGLPTILNTQQNSKPVSNRNFDSIAASVTANATLSITTENLDADRLLSALPRLEFQGKTWPALGGIPLLAKLGQGGMGTVYYGLQMRLKKEVAVKVLPLRGSDVAMESVQRFFREAQIAANVQSPHLVGVLDVNEEAGLCYLVMEFVHGVTAGQYLHEVRKSGQLGLSEEKALQLLIAATKGLAAAHAEGIIHRDVKPDNILIPRHRHGLKPGSTTPAFATPITVLTSSQTVDHEMNLSAAKLSDLGLARSEDSGFTVTLNNAGMGTPGFISPEQALDSKAIRKSADIFSMGATLYMLLSGHPPFRGATPMNAIIAAIQQPHVSLKTVVPNTSDAVQMVVECCLQKAPEKRFADGTALLEALEQCLAIVRQNTQPKILISRDHSLPQIMSAEKTHIYLPAIEAPAARPVAAPQKQASPPAQSIPTPPPQPKPAAAPPPTPTVPPKPAPTSEPLEARPHSGTLLTPVHSPTPTPTLRPPTVLAIPPLPLPQPTVPTPPAVSPRPASTVMPLVSQPKTNEPVRRPPTTLTAPLLPGILSPARNALGNVTASQWQRNMHAGMELPHLVGTIDKSKMLERIVHSIIDSGGDLPAVSRFVCDVYTAVRNPNTSSQKISAMILKDVSLTARLLRTVNSALYRASSSTPAIVSIPHAVLVLGVDTIAQLATCLNVFEQFGKAGDVVELKRLTVQTLIGGGHSRELARTIRADAELAFIAGMMSQLGLLTMAFYLPAVHNHIEDTAVRRQQSQAEACVTVLGVNYHEIGHAVAKAWNLPASVCDSLMGLTDGEQASKTDRSQTLRAVIGFGRDLSEAAMIADPAERGACIQNIRSKYADFIPISEKRLTQILETSGKSLQDMTLSMGISKQELQSHAPGLLGGVRTPPQPQTAAQRITQASYDQSMRDITHAIGGGKFSLNDAFLMILNAMKSSATLDHALLLLLTPGRDMLLGRIAAGARSLELPSLFRLRVENSDSPLAQVITNSHEIYLRQVHDSDGLPATFFQIARPRQIMLLPIVVDNISIGALYAQRVEGQELLTELEKSNLRNLRDQAVLAVKNSHNHAG